MQSEFYQNKIEKVLSKRPQAAKAYKQVAQKVKNGEYDILIEDIILVWNILTSEFTGMHDVALDEQQETFVSLLKEKSIDDNDQQWLIKCFESFVDYQHKSKEHGIGSIRNDADVLLNATETFIVRMGEVLL